MQGIVIRLEAKVHKPYGDKVVIGTEVTIKHTVFAQDEDRSTESLVFVPAGGILPLIGDDLKVSLITNID